MVLTDADIAEGTKERSKEGWLSVAGLERMLLLAVAIVEVEEELVWKESGYGLVVGASIVLMIDESLS